MHTKDVLTELERMGTAKIRKAYQRHGVADPVCGVSLGDLRVLRKKLGTDQELAQTLWKTNVFEARLLVTMIADPALITNALVGSWAKDLDNYILTDALASLVAKAPCARRKISTWTRSTNEWIARAGWSLVAHAAMEADDTSDAVYEAHLATIEHKIHDRKNRVKDAMNSALIAIGIRNDHLRELAIAAARRIGKVDVDHGETNCKTPDAEEYIEKTRRHYAARAAKAAAKKRAR